jgi:RNA polymerase sigma-70 factor (ECF subfamily)
MIMMENDTSIVRSVQEGQTEAFAALVDRHRERVYAVLMRLVADPQTAEELAQEAFVRAFQGLANFRGEARFGTWLIQIAVNLARDHIRGRQRSRFESLDAALDRDPDQPAFMDTRSQSNPLSELYENEMIKQFEIALAELPPSYREVFVLHHIENMSYEDIANTTCDSIGSLKVRAHRARKLMKERLFPDATEMAPEKLSDQER